MTILVTGGAGFIGSNFILNWIANTSEPVVNFDSLTYASSMQNLAPDWGNNNYTLVRGPRVDRNPRRSRKPVTATGVLP